MMENTTKELDILYLERKIEDHLFWLNSGSMSNPKRIKYRERALRKARKELKQLTKQK